MKYLLCVIDTESNSGNAEEMRAIDAFNDLLKANGHFVMAEGIQSPTKSMTFDNRSGAGLQHSGPNQETKEFLSGFWIIEAESLEQAQQLAADASKACNRKIELRPIYR